MKIKFNTFDEVKRFNNIVSRLESDVLIKSGRYVIDAKSIMGIFSLDLSKELEVEIIDKDVRPEEFIAELNNLGIFIK